MNQTYREMKQQYTALQQTEAYFRQQADAIRAKVNAFRPAALVFYRLWLRLLPLPVGGTLGPTHLENTGLCHRGR